MKVESLLFCTIIGALVLAIDGIRMKQPRGFADFSKLKQIDNNAGRILGGETAEKGFAPYQISLQYADWQYHLCGGSIIDKNWILTAAHCVDGSTAEEIAVITGTNEWAKPGAKYFVDQIHMHCNYNQPGYANDIALLHLNVSIEFDEFTKPIALPKKPLKHGDDLILTGWGSTELWGSTPDQLQKIKLKFVERSKCMEMFNNDSDYDVSHICTFTRQGEGACHGDSGGPLVNMNGEVEGVVNWGYPCAMGYPDAFGNVLFFRDWIRNVKSGNAKCKK